MNFERLVLGKARQGKAGPNCPQGLIDSISFRLLQELIDSISVRLIEKEWVKNENINEKCWNEKISLKDELSFPLPFSSKKHSSSEKNLKKYLCSANAFRDLPR